MLFKRFTYPPKLSPIPKIQGFSSLLKSTDALTSAHNIQNIMNPIVVDPLKSVFIKDFKEPPLCKYTIPPKVAKLFSPPNYKSAKSLLVLPIQ